MNIIQYQSQTHATCVVKAESIITYMALGLCEEAGEVANALDMTTFEHSASQNFDDFLKSVAMECGDVMWYASECARAWGLDLAICRGDEEQDKHAETTYWARRLVANAVKIAGLTKKLIRDADMQIDDQRRNKVETCLGNIITSIRCILRTTPYTLEWVLDENIQKLTRRKSEGTLHGDGSNR